MNNFVLKFVRLRIRPIVIQIKNELDHRSEVIDKQRKTRIITSRQTYKQADRRTDRKI